MAAKDIDTVFKALADPSRRELLDRLHTNNGQSLTDLCKGLDMTRQSVTQHLGVLEDANLVSIRWQGREKLHYFNPVPIHEIYERWIRKFEEERLSALHDLKRKLERKSS
jgi:DNA-binding transcriptional ArsR family regulator